MATLSGNKIKDTYQSLVKFSDNGNITTSAKQLTDGFGNNSPIYVSTTQVGIGVTPEAGLNLHVFGDAKIGSNLTVIGNLVVEGSTTTVGTDTLTVKDPLIVLANNNTSTDAVDIGFYGKYTPSGTTLYSGLFREALTGKYRLFKGLEDEPTTTVNTSGTGYAQATLIAALEGNVTGNVTGNLTGNVTGDLTGNVTATSVLADGVTATTQADGDNSTKVATTAYVDTAIEGHDTLAEVLAGGNTSGGTSMIISNGDDLTVNTSTLKVDSTNSQVGINNASPSGFTGQYSKDLIIGDGTGDRGITIYSSSSAYGSLFFKDAEGSSTANGGFIAYNHFVDGMEFGIGNAGLGAGSLSIGSTSIFMKKKLIVDATYSTTNTLTVDPSNVRVGIFNDSPSYRLDVAGDARFTGQTIIGSDLTVDTDTLFVDASEDSVGINTANPSSYSKHELVITAPDEGGITIASGTDEAAYLAFADSTSSPLNYIRVDHDGDAFEFHSNSTFSFQLLEGVEVLGLSSTSVDIRESTTIHDSLTVDDNATFTGDLGIGGSPSHPLDVKGADTNNATIARFYSNTGTRGSFVINNGTGVSPTAFIGTAGGSEQLSIGTNSTEAIRIDGSQNATFAGSVDAQDMRLQSSGTTYLNIGNDSTGSASSDGASIGYFTGQSSLQIVQRENDAMVFSTNSDERMRIDSSGQVKITSTGSADNNDTAIKFDINSTNHIKQRITTSSTGGYQATLELESGGNAVSIATSGSNEIIFNTSSSEKMRIDSNGSIGMGHNVASYRLRVKSEAGTVQNGVYISAGTGNGNHSLYVEDRDSTAEFFAVRGDGEIRLNASSGHTYAAQGIRFGTNASANNLDDYEEGTWTPIASDFSGNNATIDATNSVGVYTKIGDLLYWRCTIQMSSKGSMVATDTFRVQGFPFTSISIAGNWYRPSSAIIKNVDFDGFVNFSWVANSTYGYMFDSRTGAAGTTILVSDLSNNSAFSFSGVSKVQ